MSVGEKSSASVPVLVEEKHQATTDIGHAASTWAHVYSARFRGLIAGKVALLLMVAAIGMQFGDYYRFIFGLVAIYGIVSLGNNLLLGHARLLSLCQGALMALGAYAGGMAARAGANALEMLLVGAGAAAVAGLIVGLPALRISGHFFAAVTLLAAVATTELLLVLNITGGADGLAVLPNPFSPDGSYWVAYALLIVALVTQELILRGRFGRNLHLIGESPRAAASMGINISTYKLGAFIYSGVLAGIAGALYAAVSAYLQPELFTVYLSIYILAAVVIGGMNRPVGALLGAAVVAAVPQLTMNSAGLAPVIFGSALIAGIVLPRLWRRALQTHLGQRPHLSMKESEHG